MLAARTKGVIARGRMAEMGRLCSFVDCKKLIFLGRLCRLKQFVLAKDIFLQRFYQFLHATESDCDLSGRGFIPDIVDIIVKYDLWEYFANYIRDGYFPSKAMWRNIVNKGIKLYEERGYKDCVALKTRCVEKRYA